MHFSFSFLWPGPGVRVPGPPSEADQSVLRGAHQEVHVRSAVCTPARTSVKSTPARGASQLSPPEPVLKGPGWVLLHLPSFYIPYMLVAHPWCVYILTYIIKWFLYGKQNIINVYLVPPSLKKETKRNLEMQNLGLFDWFTLLTSWDKSLDWVW